MKETEIETDKKRQRERKGMIETETKRERVIETEKESDRVR